MKFETLARGGRVLRACLVLALSVSPLQARLPAPDGDSVESTVPDLRTRMRDLVVEARDQVFPALVHIEGTSIRHVDGREIKGRTGGSGAIISEQGHVVTNHHVVENGSEFRCSLADKRVVAADLVGSDPLTDLAVLRLRLEELEPGEPLRPAPFGDSSRLEIGDYVLAMGSPFTLARSVSLGIVSNTERVFGPGVGGGDLGGIELDLGQRTGLFTRWIQHDAALNPGNSGGPLVDLDGEVVGINQLGGDQVGFAIPSNLAREVAASLIAHGSVPRSWIGVSFRPLEGSGMEQGALVSSIVSGGPADLAGLEVGDLVLSLDGDPLELRHLEEVPGLLKRIADLPIGEQLEIDVSRASPTGRTQTSLRLETAAWPRDRGERRALGRWGLTVQDLTDKTVADYRLATSDGVLVTGVRPGSVAALAEPPLRPEDVILELGGRPVHDLATLLELYEDRPGSDSGREALLRVNRRGESLLVVLRERDDLKPTQSTEVAKGWLGVESQPLTPELARLLGRPGATGLRITRVYAGTPAAKAGLQVGDIVEAVDETRLAPRRLRDGDLLTRLVRRREIGDLVTLTLFGAPERRRVDVEIGAARTEPVATPRLQSEPLEMTVREVTLFDRDAYLWDAEVQGVLVDEIEAAGRARLAGLRPYDLVQQLALYPVRDLKSYQAALDRLERERPEHVMVIVRRGVRTFLKYVRPNW